MMLRKPVRNVKSREAGGQCDPRFGTFKIPNYASANLTARKVEQVIFGQALIAHHFVAASVKHVRSADALCQTHRGSAPLPVAVQLL